MVDLLSLTSALSEEEPCGPDLEEAGDMAFGEFIALAEGRMPAGSFFDFDKTSINLGAELETVGDLMAETRDLRLLSYAAKFSILVGDLTQFADSLEAMAVLLDEHWEQVHPQGEDGDFMYRMAQVQALNDMKTVVLPLHYIPLLQSRTLGSLTFRRKMIADGDVSAREDEEGVDGATIQGEITQADDVEALVALHGDLDRCVKSLEKVTAFFQERAGYDYVPNLALLEPVLGKMVTFVGEALSARDPGLIADNVDVAAEVPTGEESSAENEALEETVVPMAAPVSISAGDQPDLTTSRDAGSALDALEKYFTRYEPSNPSLLLIRQAQQVVGKSFIEAMDIVFPGVVDQSVIQLSGAQSLEIPLIRLKDFSNVSADDALEGDVNSYSAVTRAEALGLVGGVESYYRRFEPSSPIPLLLARVRHYANKDFTTLMNELVKAAPAANVEE